MCPSRRPSNLWTSKFEENEYFIMKFLIKKLRKIIILDSETGPLNISDRHRVTVDPTSFQIMLTAATVTKLIS